MFGILGMTKWVGMGFLCQHLNSEFVDSLGESTGYQIDPVALVFQESAKFQPLALSKPEFTQIVTEHLDDFSQESLVTALRALKTGEMTFPVDVGDMVVIAAAMLSFFFLLQVFQTHLAKGEGDEEKSSYVRTIILGVFGVAFLAFYPFITGLLLGPCEALAHDFGSYYNHARAQGGVMEIVNQTIQQYEIADYAEREDSNSNNAEALAAMHTSKESAIADIGNMTAEILQVIAGALAWAAYGLRQILLAITLLFGPIFFSFLVYDPLRPMFFGWIQFFLLTALWKPIIVVEMALVELLQVQAVGDYIGASGTGDAVAISGCSLLLIVLIISSPFTASALTKGAGLGIRSGAMKVMRFASRLHVSDGGGEPEGT